MKCDVRGAHYVDSLWNCACVCVVISNLLAAKIVVVDTIKPMLCRNENESIKWFVEHKSMRDFGENVEKIGMR